jgi:uncharacterized protein YbjT (DUF2867 family)
MILVVGATGSLGGRIVGRLLQQGKNVRILVREGRDYKHMVEAGAEAVIGDLKDRKSLDAACANITTVVTTATAIQRSGEDTLENVDLDGTQALIDAANQAGVQHFIYTSAMMSDPNSPAPLPKIKGLIEKYLKDSELTYTILRPGVFIEPWWTMLIGVPMQADQPISLIRPGSAKQAFLSEADVAAFAVACVDNPASHNKSLSIGGPENISWTEAVRLVGNVLGKQLETKYVDPGNPLPLLPPEIGMMATAMEMNEDIVSMHNLCAKFGVTLTPFETCIKQLFVPQV